MTSRLLNEIKFRLVVEFNSTENCVAEFTEAMMALNSSSRSGMAPVQSQFCLQRVPAEVLPALQLGPEGEASIGGRFRVLLQTWR